MQSENYASGKRAWKKMMLLIDLLKIIGSLLVKISWLKCLMRWKWLVENKIGRPYGNTGTFCYSKMIHVDRNVHRTNAVHNLPDNTNLSNEQSHATKCYASQISQLCRKLAVKNLAGKRLFSLYVCTRKEAAVEDCLNKMMKKKKCSE